MNRNPRRPRVTATALLASVLAAVPLRAQDSTAVPPAPAPVAVSGFIDAYYGYDFGRPATIDRRFTTQAVRHNEVNINLAYAALTVAKERVRGRLALQFGTSVQANYAGEPRVGENSGPDVSRHLQEATVGVRVAPTVWVDGGVYFSYIGLESWISRDNPAYTRSLVAEYTPYYLSGAKVTWQPNARLTAQVHVMNGWQNISENNGGKAVGLRLDYAVSPRLTLSYANFAGNEQPSGSPSRLRLYNQVMAKGTAGRLELQGQLDYGRQAKAAGTSTWYGATVVARARVAPRLRIAGRVERFHDPDQVVVTTGTADGFRTNGASIGTDVELPEGVLWRTEFKVLRGSSPYFAKDGVPASSRNDGLLVTSLALTL